MTYTVTDSVGNASTFTAQVTVVDDEAPDAVCQSATIYVDANGDALLTTADVDGGSTDNCGIETYILDRTSFTCTDLGANTVSMIVIDTAGNADTCAATVTVLDTIAPLAAISLNVTVALDTAGVATITAADVDAGSSDNCALASVTVSPSTFTCADLGTQIVTLTATDSSGNSASVTAPIQVVDLLNPTFVTCSAGEVVVADSLCSGVVPDYTALPSVVEATDNCGATLTQVPAAGTALALGVATTVEIVATDGSGNAETCTFAVTLVDSTAPTFTFCPGDIGPLTNDPTDCDRDFFFSTPQVADNCSGATPGSGGLTLAVTTDNGTNITQGVVFGGQMGDFGSFPVGVTTVTYTATDGSGNSATCSFTVTVEDVTPPSLNGLPASPVALDNDPGQCGAAYTLPQVFAADNCAVASVTNDAPALFPIGTTTVTVTVLDVNGNTTTGSFDVVVTDVESASIACPASVSATAAAGAPDAVVAIPPAVVTDNCPDSLTVTYTTTFNGVTSAPQPGLDASGTYAVGTTTVEFSVTEGGLVVAMCDFEVTVVAPNTNTLLVSPRMFLQGGLASLTSMRTDLSDNGVIPPADPETGQVATGNIGAGSGVVDYVQVVLRAGSAGAAALDTVSGLLLANGDVVGLDGASPVAFTGYPDGAYFIQVDHRNHLGVMSGVPVALNAASTTTIDFTTPSTGTFGVGSQFSFGGITALYAGDANNDGIVAFVNTSAGGQPVFSDYNLIYFATLFGDPGSSPAIQNQFAGYFATDINLDGVTNLVSPAGSLGLSDSEVLFNLVLGHPGNSTNTLQYTFGEQLP